MTRILNMKGFFIFVYVILLTQAATAQTCNDYIPASTPDDLFIRNGDEVTDTETELIWQRCSLGQTGDACDGGSAIEYNWQKALQAAEIERAATGKTWRLPNIKELRSILEEKCNIPAINLAIFPNTIFPTHWSASPHAIQSDYAWYVNFLQGYLTYGNKNDGRHVRLVRNAQ